MSDSLQLHEPQHTRPPCPSPAPGVHPNPCPWSRWCHPTISSSVVSFSSCPQSFPAPGSFPMSELFASGGQSIGVPASTSVLPMNTQDWSPLGWTGWISLLQAHNSIHCINSRYWSKDKPFSTCFHVTHSLQQGRRGGPCYFLADIFPVELKTKQHPLVLHGMRSATEKCMCPSESETYTHTSLLLSLWEMHPTEQLVNWIEQRWPFLPSEGLGTWLHSSTPAPAFLSVCTFNFPCFPLALGPRLPQMTPHSRLLSSSLAPAYLRVPRSQPLSNLAWSVYHLHLTSLLNFGASLGKGLYLNHAWFSVISYSPWTLEAWLLALKRSLCLWRVNHNDWRRKWQPTQYSCLENPIDRGAWWAAVHGVTKSQTRLSDWHTHTSHGEQNTFLNLAYITAQALVWQIWKGDLENFHRHAQCLGVCQFYTDSSLCVANKLYFGATWGRLTTGFLATWFENVTGTWLSWVNSLQLVSIFRPLDWITSSFADGQLQHVFVFLGSEPTKAVRHSLLGSFHCALMGWSLGLPCPGRDLKFRPQLPQSWGIFMASLWRQWVGGGGLQVPGSCWLVTWS